MKWKYELLEFRNVTWSHISWKWISHSVV